MGYVSPNQDYVFLHCEMIRKETQEHDNDRP